MHVSGGRTAASGQAEKRLVPRMFPHYRVPMPTDRPLTPADPAEFEQALAHALQFDGRKAFKVSGESMARITAAHLAECLARAGFVVMRKPALAAHSSEGLKQPRD
jgi:hypothetical protein